MKIKQTTSASILLIVVFALIAAWQLIPAAREVLRTSPYLSVIVIQLLILALPSVFYCTLRGKEFRAGLRINLFPLSAIILIVSASVLIVSGSGLIGAGMNALFPEAFSASSSTAAAGSADSFYYVIAFAVVPAITEEVLFRGIILTEFTSKGVFCAVTVSSLAFAMSHFSFVRFPVYLFSGLVLAAVTFAARSLIAAVIVHLVNNIFVVFFEDYVMYLTRRQNVSSVLIIFILAVAFFIAAVVTAFEAASLYKSYGKANRDSSYLPDKKARGSLLRAFSESVFSPAFLIAAVIFVVVSYIL
jgi:membrane protease YdiL (CAAX protease family)